MNSTLPDLQNSEIIFLGLAGSLFSIGLGRAILWFLGGELEFNIRMLSISMILIGLMIISSTYTGNVDNRGATVGDYAREGPKMGNRNHLKASTRTLSVRSQRLVVFLMLGGLLSLSITIFT